MYSLSNYWSNLSHETELLSITQQVQNIYKTYRLMMLLKDILQFCFGRVR